MVDASAHAEIPRHGKPARVIRLFGWSVLTVLAAFLINDILVVWFGFPGVRNLSGNPLAWVEVALFAAAFSVSFAVVLTSPARSLRWDARLVHTFNLYLVRALFFSVLFVGIADASIGFLRAEGFLGIFGEQAPHLLSRANWVGPWIHTPLIVLGFVVALFARRTLGFPWLALLIVGAELLIVISRFVFSYEQALMGDLVRYWYAALFLLASAYTLFDDGHVRVDILYAGFARRTKGRTNSVGAILLGMTTTGVVLFVAFNGPQSIVNAPVHNFEISQAGPFGMFIKYQMAAFIGLYGATMLIQFVSFLFSAVADARGEPGHREPTEPTAH